MTLCQTAPTTTSLIAGKLASGPLNLSQSELAAEIGRTERSVRRALIELETAGIIERRRHTGSRRPDEIVSSGHRLAEFLGDKRRDGRPDEWPIEVTQLRDAMLDAGIRCSWRTLRPDVIADIVSWVRTIGVGRLVREAKLRMWSPVIRHVAAFLRFWRDMRPVGPRRCAFHPAQLMRSCPDCATDRAAARPMPTGMRDLFRRRTPLLQSAPTRQPTQEARP